MTFLHSFHSLNLLVIDLLPFAVIHQISSRFEPGTVDELAGHPCHILGIALLGVEAILDSHLLVELVLVIGMTLGNALPQVLLGDDFGWSRDDHVWVAFFPAFVRGRPPSSAPRAGTGPSRSLI